MTSDLAGHWGGEARGFQASVVATENRENNLRRGGEMGRVQNVRALRILNIIP